MSYQAEIKLSHFALWLTQCSCLNVSDYDFGAGGFSGTDRCLAVLVFHHLEDCWPTSRVRFANLHRLNGSIGLGNFDPNHPKVLRGPDTLARETVSIYLLLFLF